MEAGVHLDVPLEVPLAEVEEEVAVDHLLGEVIDVVLEADLEEAGQRSSCLPSTSLLPIDHLHGTRVFMTCTVQQNPPF